jgi:hypothetical protein
VQKYTEYSDSTGIYRDDDQGLSNGTSRSAFIGDEGRSSCAPNVDEFLFGKLLKKTLIFIDEREWGEFDEVRNLALALMQECAELGNLFAFKGDKKSAELSMDVIYKVQKELADVTIYFVRFAYRLDCLPIAGENA